MVTIRLSRGGAKKQPFYHVVATDSRARRDGRYIERLGYYNPVARGEATEVQIDLDRVDRCAQQRTDLARDALDAEAVAAVGCQIDFNNRVVKTKQGLY